MEPQKDIYCDMDFWNSLENVFINTPHSPLDSSYSKFENGKHLFDAIMRAHKLYVGDAKSLSEELKKQGLLFKLKKLSATEGYVDITYNNKEQPNSLDLNAVYLVWSQNEYKSAVQQLTINQGLESSHLYKDFGKAISKSIQTSWKEILSDALHACNAMVIFDHYLLKDKEKNLYNILNLLLPDSLPPGITFQLSLFVSDKCECALIEELKKINQYISGKKPNLSVEITIYPCGANAFHDRAILTNHLWINSGGGFDLLVKDTAFHDKSSKTTIISILYPFLQHGTDWAIKAYKDFLLDASKVRKTSRHEGTNNNRLIDWIEQFQ